MKRMLFVFLVIALFFLAGCQKQANEESADSTGEVKEFKVIAKSWEFIPDTIEVNIGDRVKLNIKSIDVMHGFMLPEFGINEQLKPDQDVLVDFIADKKGTFSFACSVPCGRGHGGMRGQLIVK